MVDEVVVWAAARGGDSRAFGSIYDLHYDRVFRHVARVTDQRADADEVTASAFFELWRRRDHVRVVNASVLPWLLVTAGNLARNHGRKAQRYRALLARLPREVDLLDLVGAAVEAEDAGARVDALATALRRLRPADANLLALTMQEGVSVADAATVLGLSAGAARVRLHRVRQALRSDVAGILELSERTGESA